MKVFVFYHPTCLSYCYLHDCLPETASYTVRPIIYYPEIVDVVEVCSNKPYQGLIVSTEALIIGVFTANLTELSLRKDILVVGKMLKT
ncbi:hypothetical protein PoB_005486100 [Plakobranchus ocellatus]|uniref:Uncharacterized protein n=1 Tax=Plakobranchus ocellatus TaxID=259542 RepID=A0AAV4C6M3_9GAST|nr:hypothetical protein PoB_005486100 [Plakobranchus ocellatus]